VGETEAGGTASGDEGMAGEGMAFLQGKGDEGDGRIPPGFLQGEIQGEDEK